MAQMDREAAVSAIAAGPRHMPFGIEREVVIMKLIKHPSVISLYDVWENRGELYLVLEYVEGGELFDYVTTNGALEENEAVRLFCQIIAGLSYCHRFNICHRDLKPENILLDADGNIKLADFGMAALQPRGRWLNTSCGSPHYAAPEIISAKPYRGDKVDIWSVGIILYAMLHGSLPFDGDTVEHTLYAVRKGDYHLGDHLSPEAHNLIQRILQKRPEQRISINEIWKHPLIRKYEAYHQAWGFTGLRFGPLPPLTSEDCGPLRAQRSELNPELLRNLATLWHGIKQEDLIERLLSDDRPNHEKLFYRALLNFWEDQLENYSGPSPLDYSASDYHHAPMLAPKRIGKSPSALLVPNHGRKRSDFSILSDDPTKPDSYCKGSATANTIGTNTSYDPYRASRKAIVKGSKTHVVVRRRSTSASKRHSITLNNSQRAASLPQSNSRFSSDTNHFAHLERASRSTTVSRTSLASSHRAFSGGFRKSASHKRQVSFVHSRRSSTASVMRNLSYASIVKSFPTSSGNSASQSYRTSSMQKSLDSSPEPYHPPVPPKPDKAASELNVKKGRRGSSVWKDETRKVSSELGKICEEAFNRTSMSPNSVSRGRQLNSSAALASASRETAALQPRPLRLSSAMKNRPLPDTPVESLGSMTVRELAETRRRLLQHCQASGSNTIPAYLRDVIANLDRLMSCDQDQEINIERRAASHPAAVRTKGSRLAFNPITSPSPQDQSPRVVSAPLDRRTASIPPEKGQKTVRLVSNPYDQSQEHDFDLDNRDGSANNATPLQEVTLETSLPPSSNRSGPRLFQGLDTIEEDPRSPRVSTKANLPLNRKWSWFKRHSDSSNETVPPPPPEKDSADFTAIPQLDLDESANTADSPQQESVTRDEALTESTQGPPVKETKPGRKWFAKVFKKSSAKRGLSQREEQKGTENFPQEALLAKHTAPRRPDNPVQASQDLINSVTPTRAPYANHDAGSPAGSSFTSLHDSECGKDRTIQVSQNWFAKFLHLKPATKLLYLSIPRARARKETIKILREWRRYGLRDIVTGAGGSVVFARVDAMNYFMMKPVELAGEFIAVMEHGQRNNPCVIRMTQERGAASSFFKVVETLEGALQTRGHLVLDRVRQRKMELELARSGF
ncbi:MAG: hypothetical protein Q9227_008656 [Pyrenula ochraceoflavens]